MKKKETAKVCCKQKCIKRMYLLSLVEYLPAVKETGVMYTDIRESLGTILQDILIDSVRDIFFLGKITTQWMLSCLKKYSKTYQYCIFNQKFYKT